MQPTPYRREPGYAERYRDERFRTGHGARTDARERAALRRLLATLPTLPGARSPGPTVGWPRGAWLDVPAGAGRMTAELPGAAVLADRDPRMVAAAEPARPRVAACATALPFADGAFAGALCCRLLQHLPRAEERIAVLRELRRVARGPVVVSFFDACSLLHLRRVLRRALGKTRSGRCAISRAAFRREAHAAGLEPVRFASLGRLVAEQTFALCLPLA
ncbi:MAG: class I SAM-dependent methyltransferase [Planctomycetota bacterium]